MKNFHLTNQYKIMERMESYIYEHQLAPNAKLPSERYFSELWGCHRNTVRAAIRVLASRGEVYTKRNSGSYIAPPPLRRNLCDFEPFTKCMERQGRELRARVLEFSQCEANKTLARHMQLPLGSKLFFIRRLRSLDNLPVVLECSYLEAKRFKGLDNYDFSKNSLYDVIENLYKVQLDRWEQRISLTYFDEIDAEMLKGEPGKAAFHVSGEAFDVNSSPVEHFDSVIRADLISFCYSVDE